MPNMSKKGLVPYLFAFSGAALLLVAFSRMRSLVLPDASDPLAFITSSIRGEPYCKWVFSHYESSEYEESWLDRIEAAQNDICRVVAEPVHAEASRVIVDRTLELMSLPLAHQWPSYDSFPLTPMNASRDIYMSRMHYNRTCYDPSANTFNLAPGKGIQLIEPLWGMLRDPFDHYCKDKALYMAGHNEQTGQSKAHIMPQGYAPYTYSLTDDPPQAQKDSPLWRSHGIPPWHSSLRPVPDQPQLPAGNSLAFETPKNVHLDLGSSYFGIWGSNAAAASGHWFYNTYHARGQPFSRFIAVEVEKLEQKKAFDQIPADLVGAYNLMNVPLSMDDGDKLNTMDLIRRVVKEEDFFVFKLDIDSAPIEEPIVKALLEEEDGVEGSVSGLIDELMFEHHVAYDPMNGPWGYPKGVGDLHRSYNVFRDLRKKGIRAHSWP
ncbi:MAG: hypothetical protein LQ344_008037 [Seirophora lacunosa]|nr:MAG: hypothetical protein LQ344_008037 [Seirophora lacunosa]